MPELDSIERGELIAAATGCLSGGASELNDLVEQSRGPGAFEGNDDLTLAVALDVLCGVSGWDEAAGDMSEVGTHGARFGRAVLWTDVSGFMTVDVFLSEAEAVRELHLLDHDDCGDDFENCGGAP